MRLHDYEVPGHTGQYAVELPATEVYVPIRILFEPCTKIRGVWIGGEFFNLETEHEGLGRAAKEYLIKYGQLLADKLVIEELGITKTVYKLGYEDCVNDRKGDAEAINKAYEEKFEYLRKKYPVLYIKNKRGRYEVAPVEL